MKKTAVFLCLFTAVTFFAQQSTTTREEILSHPDWKAAYDAFSVDPVDAAELKARLIEDYRVDVYLAYWCPDSEEHIPSFLKIMDVVNLSHIPIQYYLCERKQSRDIKYYVEEFKVERIPTFIFYRGEKEAGRIIEHPQAGMVEDILKIITR